MESNADCVIMCRCQGSDIAQGSKVLEEGELVSEAQIGLLASMGITMVKVKFLPTVFPLSLFCTQVPETMVTNISWYQVYPMPKVALLSTGDELVDPFSNSSVGKGKV